MCIGNDGSAFVEALVSRSGDDADNYEVKTVTLVCVFDSTTCTDILHCGFIFAYIRCC